MRGGQPRLGWIAGGSVRLKRPMRHMGGSCALSALCAIRVGFGRIGAGFRFLYFGPEGCGPSWPVAVPC